MMRWQFLAPQLPRSSSRLNVKLCYLRRRGRVLAQEKSRMLGFLLGWL